MQANAHFPVFSSDMLLRVASFTRQPDGEDVVIGRPETGIFLALPLDAIDILDGLAQGKTVGEVQRLYEQKYGETPDLDDFLSLLQQKGFVRSHDADQHASGTVDTSIATVAAQQPTPVRFHFANFPQPLAQSLFGRPALALYSLIILSALIVIAIEPSVVPGWSAYIFKDHMSLMVITLTLLTYTSLFFHEMAHLIAARAVGVSARLGLGHRLWVLVAETDLTGVWAIPRQQRYLPFIAGALLDAVSAAGLILLFFASQRGWIVLNQVVLSLGRALLLSYLLRLLWQCYFFVQTDFYYVIATYYNCKSLIKDTQTLLWNMLVRISGRGTLVDQSHIPAAEMRIIRRYVVVWVGGRIAALSALLFVSLPVMYTYLLTLFHTLSAGYRPHPYVFIDALVLGSLFIVMQGTGFWLWFRSLYLAWR